MEIGTRVSVLSGAGYRDKFVAMAGTVVYNSGLAGTKIGVELDKKDNPGSKYNAFWFEKERLNIIKPVESEEKFMLPNYTIVNIQFLDGTNTSKLYSYACYDPNILEGDTVVVMTGHHGMALAKVAEVAPDFAEPVKDGREIISRVDMTAYEERKATAKRMQTLKTTMDAKVKELQSMAIYELLAKDNPEMQKMLDEFKALMFPGQKKEDAENV